MQPRIFLFLLLSPVKLKNIDFLGKLKNIEMFELTFNEKKHEGYVYFDTSNLKILKSCHSLKQIIINGFKC